MNRSLLVDLPVFLAVARLGNMTRAAAVLHTVQSNVTARIKRLEDEIGATLIVRGSRKLRLTSEGEALMPFALRLEELFRDYQRALSWRRRTPDWLASNRRDRNFRRLAACGAYCAVHGAPPFY